MKKIINNNKFANLLQQISAEIIASTEDINNTILMGICTEGIPISLQIAEMIKEKTGILPACGIIDITLYRDDLDRHTTPIIKETKIPCSIDDKEIILVDDVLYTGRTTRAAMDQMIDFGRPKKIKLAVLIDRGGRELPIEANFIGQKLDDVNNDDQIIVKTQNVDGENSVSIIKREK